MTFLAILITFDTSNTRIFPFRKQIGTLQGNTVAGPAHCMEARCSTTRAIVERSSRAPIIPPPGLRAREVRTDSKPHHPLPSHYGCELAYYMLHVADYLVVFRCVTMHCS